MNEEALREAMENDEHVRRLGRFVGVASLERNLAMEDEAVRRAILGQNPMAPTGSQMLAARDATVQNHFYYNGQAGPVEPRKEPEAEVAPEPVPTTAPVSPPTTADIQKIVIGVLGQIKKAKDAAKPVPAPAPAPIPVVGKIPSDWPRQLLYGSLAAAAIGFGFGTPLALFLGGSDQPAAVDTDTDQYTETTFPE